MSIEERALEAWAEHKAEQATVDAQRHARHLEVIERAAWTHWNEWAAEAGIDCQARIDTPTEPKGPAVIHADGFTFELWPHADGIYLSGYLRLAKTCQACGHRWSSAQIASLADLGAAISQMPAIHRPKDAPDDATTECDGHDVYQPEEGAGALHLLAPAEDQFF